MATATTDLTDWTRVQCPKCGAVGTLKPDGWTEGKRKRKTRPCGTCGQRSNLDPSTLPTVQ